MFLTNCNVFSISFIECALCSENALCKTETHENEIIQKNISMHSKETEIRQPTNQNTPKSTEHECYRFLSNGFIIFGFFFFFI